MTHVLDNPIWESLQTHHAKWALTDKTISRYPRDVGPFLGVSAEHSGSEASLHNLLLPGELVYFFQHWPTLNDDYEVHPYEPLPQLVCESRITNISSGPEITVLDNEHRADMLSLTALPFASVTRRAV